LVRTPWYLVVIGHLIVASIAFGMLVVALRYGAIGSQPIVDKLGVPAIFGALAGLMWTQFGPPRVRARGAVLTVVNPFVIWHIPADEIHHLQTSLGLRIKTRNGRRVSVAACPQSPWAGLTGNRHAIRAAERLELWRGNQVPPTVAELSATHVRREINWTAFGTAFAVAAAIVSLTAVGLMIAT
jgi:hypothetical protein